MNSDLMRVFRFTADDLAYNKQGRLSPRQVTRLKRNNRVGAVIMFILLLVSLTFTVVVLRPFAFNGVAVTDNLFRFLGGLGLVLLSIFFLMHFLKFLFRTNTPVVTKLQGKVHGVITRKERDSEGDILTVHYLQIGEQEIHIQEYQAPVFQEEHTYAIYQDKALGNISVEHLGGPPEA